MLVAFIGNSAEAMLNFRGSLIRRAVASGSKVAAFAPDFCDETRAAVQELGAFPFDFPLSRGGASPVADIMSLVVLTRELRRLRPDAVLSFFVKPAIYGNLAAALVGVRRRVIMLEGLGYGFAETKAPSLSRRAIEQLIKLLLRISTARADTTLVLNEDDRVTLVEQVGTSPDRVVNMGGIGVELDEFKPSPVRKDVKVFAMAARLIAEKGVQEYVEAARRIRISNSSVRFLLLGDVDDNPNSLTTEQVSAWRDAGVVEWPGRVNNIRDWLKQADVFVLPSYYREGVPRSTQEAMALGRPIITTDHVGCRDTVTDGLNGFLVPPRDVHALTEAMLKLVNTAGLAQQMGEASRRLAEQKFDASKADSLILGLLNDS